MIVTVGLLLSALLSTASSLSCVTCSQNNAIYCEGFSLLCPNETFCGSLLLSKTAGGQTQWNIARGCFQEEQCGQPMIFRFANATSKQIISCCSEDDCTPLDQLLPEDNNEPNGMTCPTCFSTQPNGCFAEETINCAGDETQCASVTLSGPLTGEVSFQGCSDDNLCTFGNYNVSATTSSIVCANTTDDASATGIPSSNSTSTIGNTTGSSDTNDTVGDTTNAPFTISSSDIKDVSENAGSGCSGLQGPFLLSVAALFVLMNLLS